MCHKQLQATYLHYFAIPAFPHSLIFSLYKMQNAPHNILRHPVTMKGIVINISRNMKSFSLPHCDINSTKIEFVSSRA
jgi:hypothetical protein